MGERQTVVIKGVTYDATTGEPLHTPKHATTPPAAHAIQKFAPHQPSHHAPKISDIAPVRHPVVAAAHAKQSAQVEQRTPRPAQAIKQQAIAEAMEKTAGHSRKQVKPKKIVSKAQRRLHFATGALAVFVLAGYLTYLTMPAVSTRIAAIQSGIDATYPTYTPSGYRISGPVVAKNGTVSLLFAANAGPQNYNITEEKSSWDSTAVRENYIKPQVGESYVTTQSNGLTIYTYNQNAAWVNGGILYTLTGTAPLSSDQIQRIAVSM